MQFYILDEDPVKNLEILPKYAIDKVNIREGWQILSDIGHICGVTWEGQNKLYSASHVLTRSFARDRTTFLRFIKHYTECVCSRKNSFYHKYGKTMRAISEIVSKLPDYRSETEYMIQYLLDYKSDKLTEEEIASLKKVVDKF